MSDNKIIINLLKNKRMRIKLFNNWGITLHRAKGIETSFVACDDEVIKKQKNCFGREMS